MKDEELNHDGGERERRHDTGRYENRTQVLLDELLLSLDEVCELLKCPAETVRYLHRVGILKAVRVGKFSRWKPADVQKFIEELKPKKD